MWNRDAPVSVVSLHWWPRRDWSSTGLRPQLSLGPRADNVTVPLDLTRPSCPGFPLAAGLPSGFTTTESAGGGEPCGEPAISLDSHHISLVQWTNLFASRHKGHRFKSPGGYLCETGILLLVLSRYSIQKVDINGKLSTEQIFNISVKQGRILGPILFLIILITYIVHFLLWHLSLLTTPFVLLARKNWKPLWIC